MSHEVELAGCTPEPLMSYLKALGVFRLVAEQAHPDATACWRADCFVVRSKLDENGLVEFFLRDYRPTPIVAPWAGGSGFFGKDNRKAVEAIAQSKTPRLEPYREVIRRVQKILTQEGLTDKPNKEQKDRLLRRYRREMPDEFVQWMDTAIILQTEGQVFAPVLGTGGNDGRLDFTQNFMQRLVDQLQLVNEADVADSRPFLINSLFAVPVQGLTKAAVGQFAPGRAGGPNATQGMEGDSSDNPWDFVLMLEGTLLLAGALVRRAGILSTDKAAFPFTVRARPVGSASGTDSESSEARGELWLPLWESFVTKRELELLFAEGRAELAGRPAHDAVDFARAVASLGVDRGIRQFARFGFLKRSGKAFLAVAMERFPVPDHPRAAAGLIQEIDRWLDAFRRIAGPDASARFRMAIAQIESAIFDYCRYGRREDIQNVLIALGRAQQELAVTGGKRGNKVLCPPLAALSPRWLTATHDGSLEYQLALALAGIHDREAKLPPIRANVEPVEARGSWWSWSEAVGPEVVWRTASLVRNMIGVLERRIMDGLRSGCETLPLDFKRSLSLEAVALFLAGESDDERIDQLFRSLLLIDHRAPLPAKLPRPSWRDAPVLPRAYALLKPLFLPAPLTVEVDQETGRPRWRLAQKEERGIAIRPEPRVLPLLRAGRVGEACRIAYERLRSSGLNPLPTPMGGRPARVDEWAEAGPAVDAQRLAAALLLPVTSESLNRILQPVTRTIEQPEEIESLLLESEGA